MPDTMVFNVGDRQLNGVESYSIESDLFMAASAFSVDCVEDNQTFVGAGMQIEARLNGAIELKGVIDRKEYSYDKQSNKLTISGRNKMAFVCDHCCQDFGEKNSLDDKTLLQVAELLVRDVSYINREDIKFQDGCAKFDTAFKYGKIEPGETVFEVLKRCATARGLIFYADPDGSFIFGKPRDGGAAKFNLICKRQKGREMNNITSGKIVNDISQAYSKISVIGQIQQGEYLGQLFGQNIYGVPEAVNVKAIAFVPGSVVPYVKPLLLSHDNAGVPPSREAHFEAEKQIARSLQLEYVVPFHSQAGRTWRINEICHVDDENLKLSGATINRDFLIYGVTFLRDKKNGSATKVTLGYPGVILSD